MKKLFISQPMGDYISRDMAIACLTKVEVTENLATMTDAKRAIAGMPAADVVPVSELRVLRDALYEDDQLTMQGLARINRKIENCGKTEDSVPVVRCRDCRHSYEDIDGLVCGYGVCIDSIVREDFFCATGVKREGSKP